LARACVTTPSTSSASSFCFVIKACGSGKQMRRPATEKIAPVCSPQRLAESYNPSIGLAGGSSQIARPWAHIQRGLPRRACRQTRRALYRHDCNGKTAQSRARRCQNAAVLSEWFLAGYHPTYPFAVQLSIHDFRQESGATCRCGNPGQDRAMNRSTADNQK
jgi:hypothetical protein